MCGTRVIVIVPLILNLGKRWRFAVVLMPGRFISRIKPPGVHFIGCLVGPSACLDDLEKKGHKGFKEIL
jgi:hypothetical protein